MEIGGMNFSASKLRGGGKFQCNPLEGEGQNFSAQTFHSLVVISSMLKQTAHPGMINQD